MSRTAARAPGASAKRSTEDGDICPVCKSSRYLNQNMRFLVNPECYHYMCEACVDRIFSSGPAPCPIAGCTRTLRKPRFRTQTFEDLKVEREVDIRRRVARVMNKTESDFETLKDYNDYLETVEEITWNLILKIDVEATERRLRLWDEAQKSENNQSQARRTNEPDPSLPSDNARVVLKKSSNQRKAQAGPGNPADPFAAADDAEREAGFSFRGLKKKVAPPPEKPFDPWGGWKITPQYFVVQDDYNVDWITGAKNNPSHIVGGYDMHEFYDRALQEAFGGLSVFIGDEITAQETETSGNAGVATQTAATVAAGNKDVAMDDVF